MRYNGVPMSGQTLQSIIEEIANKAILAQRALEKEHFSVADQYLDDIIELTDEAENAPAELDFS